MDRGGWQVTVHRITESGTQLKPLSMQEVDRRRFDTDKKRKQCGHRATDYNAAAAKSLQSCPTLCDPIDGSPPGSPVPRILQARTLEWVAISFSNAWKWKVKVKSLSRVLLLATPWTAAYQAPLSMGFSRQEYWGGVPLLSLTNYNDVAASRGVPAATRSWTSKDWIISESFLRKYGPAHALIWGFWISELWENKFLLFLGINFW